MQAWQNKRLSKVPLQNQFWLVWEILQMGGSKIQKSSLKLFWKLGMCNSTGSLIFADFKLDLSRVTHFVKPAQWGTKTLCLRVLCWMLQKLGLMALLWLDGLVRKLCWGVNCIYRGDDWQLHVACAVQCIQMLTFPKTSHVYRVHSCRTHIKKFTMLYQGPRIWNCLPASITNLSSFPTFKNKVLEFLLK